VAAKACQLEDQPSCPRSSPQRLTVSEILTMRRLATSEDLRHVPTGRLALLAQRRGAVFASTSTWYRMVRLRQWRRPTTRVHPQPPVEGIRATKPNEVWHIDTTILRLLDGTRLYLHAVLDTFSRRVLSWHSCERFCAENSVAVLVEAGHRAGLSATPTLLADGGVENVNDRVDELVESGLLRRVLAQTEIRFSNSLIEAWWRSLKHNWPFLHPLESVARVRSLIAFYVD
jgi:putative transposase